MRPKLGFCTQAALNALEDLSRPAKLYGSNTDRFGLGVTVRCDVEKSLLSLGAAVDQSLRVGPDRGRSRRLMQRKPSAVFPR